MTSRQHALEKALGELVGGRTPPDQTFRILAAVRRGSADTVRRRRLLSRPGLLGAAIGVAAVLALWLGLSTEEQHFPELHVQVREGELVWQTGQAGPSQEAPSQLTRPQMIGVRAAAAGEAFAVFPHIGDRLVAHSFRQTALGLDRFGSLSMTAGTQLEITDMKWQEFGIGFGSGSITVAVLVGSFAWLTGDDVFRAASGDTLELPLPAPSMAQSALEERSRQLEGELAAARAEVEQLRSAQQRKEVDAARPEEEVAVPEAMEFEPLELNPELSEALAKIDWQTVASQSLELSSALRQLMTVVANGEEVPHDLIGELERLGGTLHTLGANFEGLDALQGTNFDTRVRHPLLGAQWMSALLQYSDLPLDEVQRRAFTDLARRYAAEDDQRRAAYGDDTYLIQKYVEELQMQDRFYEDLGYVMSHAQRELFSVGDFEGRVGAKLVGEGSMAWGEWTQPVVVRTRDEFAASMTTGFANALGLEGAKRQQLGDLVQEWGQAFPAQWWDQRFDDLDQHGGFDVERLKVAAQLQLQFFDQVANSMGLTPQQLKTLRNVRSLVVPYQRK